jgi:hypothetical protein
MALAIVKASELWIITYSLIVLSHGYYYLALRDMDFWQYQTQNIISSVIFANVFYICMLWDSEWYKKKHFIS